MGGQMYTILKKYPTSTQSFFHHRIDFSCFSPMRLFFKIVQRGPMRYILFLYHATIILFQRR